MLEMACAWVSRTLRNSTFCCSWAALIPFRLSAALTVLSMDISITNTRDVNKVNSITGGPGRVKLLWPQIGLHMHKVHRAFIHKHGSTLTTLAISYGVSRLAKDQRAASSPSISTRRIRSKINPGTAISTVITKKPGHPMDSTNGGVSGPAR